MVEPARRLAQGLARAAICPATDRWPPYSRLFLVSDHPRWVIANEILEVERLARRLSVSIAPSRLVEYSRNQAAFYGSHFTLLLGEDAEARCDRHRVAAAYLHGRPDSGFEAFDRAYASLRRLHDRIGRLCVSHSEMHRVVLDAGVSPQKVFTIPLAVNIAFFPQQTVATRQAARRQLRIPDDAAVVGSFQKDGVGWGDGTHPKLEKGPDTLLQALGLLKTRITNLFVLLSGPARGYVVDGLRRLEIPHSHFLARRYADVGQMYQALDVYLLASRQEGGPKSIFEAMASAVPFVTTRVGQAMDFVRHGENGWMVEPDDAEGLTDWACHALTHRGELGQVVRNGRALAEANTYEAQVPLWREFLSGFVEIDSVPETTPIGR